VLAEQHDVVAAVGQPVRLGDHARAADRIDRRIAGISSTCSGRTTTMPIRRSPCEHVARELAIARLEQVERRLHAREQHDVRERKDRQQLGSLTRPRYQRAPRPLTAGRRWKTRAHLDRATRTTLIER
jgi:hypothetical protein